MPENNLYDEIARVAYELWEKNGCIHGRDIEHWCEAERIVISRIQPVVEEKEKETIVPKKTSAKKTSKSTGAAKRTKKSSGSAKKA